MSELLLRWEELQEQGDAALIEEFARQCSPEERAELRGRIEALRSMMDLLDTSASESVRTPSESMPKSAEDRRKSWPKIPGYEIVAELGEGGMGVVYLAQQLSLKRAVALKVLRGAHPRPEQLARFRTEAEAVARLQHPNIVQVHDIAEHDGLPYFTMEYVPGGSLARKLAGTPQPPREAAALVEVLARAVEAAHQNGIIHRDLKPSNILLVSGGVVSGGVVGGELSRPLTTHHSPLTTHQPKITDFGLAKQIDDDSGQTHTGQVLGTPSYMAPEQAAGRLAAIGPATDVYALGATLYETLTGRPPFKGVSPTDTLDQVRSREPAPPSRLAKVPRDLETICLKCLQKEPGARYASAAALAQDLRRYLQGEPIQARPVGRLERLWRWCRRNPRVAALLAALALVLGFTALTTWYVKFKYPGAGFVNERELTRSMNRARDDGRQRGMEAAFADVLTVLEQEPSTDGALSPPARKALLQQALRFYQGQEEALRGDSARPEDTALNCRRLGRLHQLLGQNAEAKESYHRAIELFRKSTKEEPEAPGHWRGLAMTLDDLGKLQAKERPNEAERCYSEAINAWATLAALVPDEPNHRLALARAQANRAYAFESAGQTTEAEKGYREAEAVLQRLVADFPATPRYDSELAGALHNLARLHLARGAQVEARELVDQAIRHQQAALKSEPNNPHYRSSLDRHQRLRAELDGSGP